MLLSFLSSFHYLCIMMYYDSICTMIATALMYYDVLWLHLHCVGECHDKATVFSSGLPNGRQDVCGTLEDCFPMLFSFGDIEIKYASSLCCHNHGFRFVSYCTTPISFSSFQTETTLSKGNPELTELVSRDYSPWTWYIKVHIMMYMYRNPHMFMLFSWKMYV